MQKLILILGTIALLASTYYLFNRRPVEGLPETVLVQFNSWKLQYNKQYDAVEEVYRLNVFGSNYVMIDKFNKHEAQKEGFVMGINQFADLTNEEFRSIYLGYKSNSKLQATQGLQQPEEMLRQAPPSSVNWVEKGDVTPVKNQGQCGSCYAFSSTGSLESVDAIFGTGLGNFSEQQLVDCSQKYGNNGCNGGLMDNCFKYVIANGITTEQAYPYTGKVGTCKVQGGAFKIKSYTDVKAKNCSALQSAVAQQPTSVAVDAQTWQFYKSGVFSRCGTSLDHGVLAVGYTPDYWLVKNSWGVTWGMQGYIELKTGDTCGICNEASYPNL